MIKSLFIVRDVMIILESIYILKNENIKFQNNGKTFELYIETT
jgi:hypothetical protein